MKQKQQGQAVVEIIVVLAALLSVGWGLLWLQRWQQIKQQTQHHAALQAFRFSQSHVLDQADDLQPIYLQGLYSYLAHQSTTDLRPLGDIDRLSNGMKMAEPEGLLGPSQRWRFSSRVHVDGWELAAWAQKNEALIPIMHLQSEVSILVGTGYAQDDLQMVSRLGASPSLWRSAQNSSAAAIEGLRPLFAPVDRAWGRADSTTSWLQPWQESVPSRHLYE